MKAFVNLETGALKPRPEETGNWISYDEFQENWNRNKKTLNQWASLFKCSWKDLLSQSQKLFEDLENLKEEKSRLELEAKSKGLS